MEAAQPAKLRKASLLIMVAGNAVLKLPQEIKRELVEIREQETKRLEEAHAALRQHVTENVVIQ
jgi:hypothetical protein